MTPNLPTGETMDEGEATPPSTDQAATAAPTMEICVPTASLAMPDDQDTMTDPEPGDAVTLQIEGKVSRIEGENAYVTPESCNGVELDQGTKGLKDQGTPDQADDYAGLQDMAKQQGMLS